MKVSARGIGFVAAHEGFRARPYKASPSEQYLTIGYGHYGPDVKPTLQITQAEGRRLLHKDLERFVSAVNALIDRKLTQTEFDALVSFTYNLGEGALAGSTLRKRLNAGDPKPKTFREELPKWVKAGGVTLQGLVIRRDDEVQLATKGKYR